MKVILEKDLVPGKIYRVLNTTVKIRYYNRINRYVLFSGINGSERLYRTDLMDDGYIKFHYTSEYRWGEYSKDNSIKFGRK